ncbi:hypothetical protein VPH35_063286 [Triticum aestivum]|uniref:DUF6598 domain-containing protein n=1 Tax=Aegilops tauschii TaxID=37682 RepID=M8BP71_AEGTA
MTGPKRGIELVSPVLIEFDIRIKNGEREEDDEQLIDRAITCNDRRAWKPVKQCIKGDCGAVDISMATSTRRFSSFMAPWFVLAVTWGDVMVLEFKLCGDNGVERRRSFKAQLLGCSSRRIKHELANILVKVTLSTI